MVKPFPLHINYIFDVFHANVIIFVTKITKYLKLNNSMTCHVNFETNYFKFNDVKIEDNNIYLFMNKIQDNLFIIYV